jgi:DNA processing protein
LKNGATIATEPQDVIEALRPMLRDLPARQPPIALAPGHTASNDAPGPQMPEIGAGERARLLAALGPAPVDIDELGRATGLPPRALQIALIELALAGRIERHGHQLVSLTDGAQSRSPRT